MVNHTWLCILYFGAAALSFSCALAKPVTFAPLSHISFDTSDEIPKSNLPYIVSMGNRFDGRPHFSIFPESQFSERVSNEDILVRGVWQDMMNQTGWNHLRIDILEEVDVPDNYKSYAAGLLEGYLSRTRIRDFFLNTRGMIYSEKGGSETVNLVRDLFRKSIIRVENIGTWDADAPLNSAGLKHPVDQLVRLAVFQIWGISDAYEAARQEFHPDEPAVVWPKIDVVDMHLLSADGDYPDLKDAVSVPKSNTDASPTAPASTTPDVRSGESAFMQTYHRNDGREMYVGSRRRQYGRCSALVRLAANSSELFVGHSTWEPYSEMTRIIKFYDFPFKGVASRQIGFPSYPGAITSTDDFIVTSSGLVLTETTIDIRNRALFRERSNIKSKEGRYSDFLKPLAAARLSKSGTEWVNLFTRYGIASCQWMVGEKRIVVLKEVSHQVVDYNKFRRGAQDQETKGLLYVLEGIPGLIHSKDMTSRLISHGYWGSANRAWFRDVRAVLGDELRLGNDTAVLSVFSRDDSPRAFAFKHLAPKVGSLSDMERLMQFSPTSPEAGGPPVNVAIAPRFDLSDKKKTPEGATDSKIVDSSLVHDLSFVGISGPEHQRHEPFAWTDDHDRNKWDEKTWPHHGMPAVWNFTWQKIDDEGLRPLGETPVLMHGVGKLDDWSDELASKSQKHQRSKEDTSD